MWKEWIAIEFSQGCLMAIMDQMQARETAHSLFVLTCWPRSLLNVEHCFPAAATTPYRRFRGKTMGYISVNGQIRDGVGTGLIPLSLSHLKNKLYH